MAAAAWTKAVHAAGVKVRAGPWGSLLSRTGITSGRLSATSTQSPPSPPLYVLLRQLAVVRLSLASMQLSPLPPL